MRNKTLVSTCRKVCLSAYKKNQLRPSLLFCDIAKKLQTCSLGNLNMPGYDKQKRYYELVENSFIFMQIKFIPPLFLEILQRYCKLVILGTLGSPTKNKSTQLLETLMFICKKINLITKFFLQILHFNESCNLIGQEDLWQLIQNKNFARHEVCNGK